MGVKDWIQDFFTRQPFPATVFQLSIPALTGLHVEGRDGRSPRHVILPLRPGSLEPSFDKPNFADPGHVADRVQDALKKLGLRDGDVTLLLPESCLKTSIMVFDEFPDSAAERVNLLAWRLRKQIPSLPEEVRLTYDVLNGGAPWRVLVTAINPSVLAEYEGLFSKQGASVRNINLPTLSLAGLLPAGGPKNGIVANIEEDGLSLLAVAEGEIISYRSKPFLADGREAKSASRRMDNVAREILNTMTFLEDREKKKVETIWVRAALSDADEDALAALKPLVALPLRPIEPAGFAGLKPREARLLAPLMGQLP